MRSRLIFFAIIGAAVLILAAGSAARIGQRPAPRPVVIVVTATPEAAPTGVAGLRLTPDVRRVSLSLPEAEVRDVRPLNGPGDALTFVGEVVNTGRQALTRPEIHILLYGKADSKLQVVTGQAEHNLVLPGERVPFTAFLDNPPSNWVRFEVIFAPELATGNEYMAYMDFDVSQDQFGPGKFANNGVAGQVRNAGEKQAKYVQAIVSFYDAENKIIGVDSTYVTDRDQLMLPGKTLPFVVDLHNYSGVDIASYRVQFVAHAE